MTQTKQQRLISCEECGLVVEIPDIQEGENAHCPRCKHTLTQSYRHPFQRPIAYAIAGLIMLVLSVSFPFMSFSVQGLSQEIGLLNAVEMLDEFQNSALALLLLTTVVILPGIYISFVLYLYTLAALFKNKKIPTQKLQHIKILCKLLFRVEPWLMVDVFLIGVLVSLVKIAAMADIGMGYSFWAFCLYTILIVKCISLVDRSWLWEQFIPTTPVYNVNAGDTYLTSNHTSCHICHQLNPIGEGAKRRCIRCDSHLHEYNPHKNLQTVWALLITATIFYIPANLYPIMYTVSLGNSSPSTIMGGVVLLWHHGSYPIASVIFIASIFIPLAKMFALAWLFFTAQKQQHSPTHEALKNQKLYRLTEFIGRWSMIDIFVVAILVALVQLKSLMAIYPGPAALSFATVVIFTMLSAMIFDSRILWQNTPINNNKTNGSTNYE